METSELRHTTILMALVRDAGVSPRLMDLLLRLFGSPEAIIQAGPGELEEIQGLSPTKAQAIMQAADHLDDAADYLKLLGQRQITVTSILDDVYPSGLKELNDPPTLLFSRGKLPVNDLKRVAVVGSEEATSGGIELTVHLARRLAADKVQIISSLRRGIDAAAHVGAEAAGGLSFAVLESGLDEAPPEDAMPVAMAVLKRGGVLSEQIPDFEAGDRAFHRSNRLVVALSQAVVLTEFHYSSPRLMDLLECCRQIGKLIVVLIDPEIGILSDEAAMARAVECGAVCLTGRDRIGDIIKSLV
jgi:DNA processing protein